MQRVLAGIGHEVGVSVAVEEPGESGVEQVVDVLADDEIRQGIKDFSSWPTIPQLYLKGEFVGGCDIVREMHESGELQKLFDDKGIEYAS